jgi:hypothetical protein
MYPRNEADRLLTDEEIRRPLWPLHWQQVNKIISASIPHSQTRIKSGDPCLYLTEQGCVLPRIHRPCICTWFMCDLHYECFGAEQPKIQREFVHRLGKIRHHRQKLSLLYDPGGKY